MSSFKNLFVVALLAAVAYGVYASINRSPTAPAAPAPVPTPNVPPAPSGLPPVSATAGGLPASIPGMPGTPDSVAPPYTPSPSSTTPLPPAAAMPGAGNPTAFPVSAPFAPATASAPSSPFGAPPPSVSAPATTTRPSVPSVSLPPISGPPGAGTPSGISPAGPAKAEAVVSQTSFASESGVRNQLQSVLHEVQVKAQTGRLAEAHLTLSKLYNDPQVPAEMAGQITESLDLMAAEVIYSRKHLLEQAYRVQPGDTLERIAESYKVPPQLLARINGIRDARSLLPGRELKVVRGPFEAVINLNRYELTLLLNHRYAGRFPIGLGVTPPLIGSYRVRNKIVQPGGYSLPPKLGLDLGNQVSIFAANDPSGVGRPGNPGSICVSNRDMDDLFAILSVDSDVLIKQ